VTQNRDSKVLILTSDPRTVAEVTKIGRRNFRAATVIYWELGEASTKPDALR